MDRGAWQATYSPWGHKELDTTEQIGTAQHNVNVYVPNHIDQYLENKNKLQQYKENKIWYLPYNLSHHFHIMIDQMDWKQIKLYEPWDIILYIDTIKTFWK